jgi:hypothetical protein
MSNHTSRRSPKKSPKRLVVWKDQAQLDARKKAAEEEAWKVLNAPETIEQATKALEMLERLGAL